MQVIIDEVVSRVRAIDGRSALAPETMRAIVDTVLAAVREEMAHDRRVRQERAADPDAARGGE
jgi:hypothetical protein